MRYERETGGKPHLDGDWESYAVWLQHVLEAALDAIVVWKSRLEAAEGRLAVACKVGKGKDRQEFDWAFLDYEARAEAAEARLKAIRDAKRQSVGFGLPWLEPDMVFAARLQRMAWE